MGPVRGLSLLDAAGGATATFLLVYPGERQDRAWWTFFLPRGRDHVDVWRPLGHGFYLVLAGYHDCVNIELVEKEPEGDVQRVTALRPRGVGMFPAGLKTCVSLAKAVLGVRAFWIITPRQLHRYIERRGGIV